MLQSQIQNKSVIKKMLLHSGPPVW